MHPFSNITTFANVITATPWTSYTSGFISYLMLEKGLSEHSIAAYKEDVRKLERWADDTTGISSPIDVTFDHLTTFVLWINELGLGPKSQARIISGVRAFYKYLFLENVIQDDPSELLEGPRLRRTIPDVLTYDEIEQLLAAIDLSHPQGHRNRAMLETLYASGLRVSELVGLKLSSYYPDVGLIKVIGKNNKERIVPIGPSAIKFINLYVNHDRRLLPKIHDEYSDNIFLNRRGRQLTRVMIFTIIKNLVHEIGMDKKVSPHTFRHSFATHLVEGGADLRAVQDLLGHESITTTEIYTHLDTQYLRDTIMQYHPRNRTEEK